MDQWVIDRYNKGQDRYCARTINHEIEIDDSHFPASPIRRSKWDFLYNPKWGFAEAFWGNELIKVRKFAPAYKPACFYYLTKMVISDDPLKYLEQFKEGK